VTAVFGLEVEPKEANQQALRAAKQVARRVRVLGKRLTRELGWAADCVIHLHTGAAGVGETGDDATRTLAAVGNTIDTARHVAAQHGDAEIARILVSEAVLTAAALDTRAIEWREIALPDDARLRVAAIDRAAPLLEAQTANAGREHEASVLMT
jgi:adenylate cyclase